ncbi:hypothetical protein [Bacillus niameyensis]|uniref:hypothetical protein n=1 Tax=Bacillus niameyensis TaxID=1522308 RepID=UPI000784EB36|nr:hypothetical protein [Bacillus niameyensis]
MRRSLTSLAKALLIVLFASALSGCSLLTAILESGDDGITFGTGTFDEGITQEKTVFSPDDDILFEAYTNNAFKTTSLHFILLKDELDSEWIYDEWDLTVDPTWNTLLYEFHLVDEYGELEQGDYILRMFNSDSELMTEGTFTVS